MSLYDPDVWCILKFETGDDTYYKVLGGWEGVHGRWRINSGITKAVDCGDFWEFYGYTGSIYSCPKNSYGVNASSKWVAENMLNSPKHNVESMPEDTDWMNLEYVV